MAMTIIGVLSGIAASVPMLYALLYATRRGNYYTAGALVACCLVPFVVLQVLMMCVNFYWHEGAMAFGVASTLTFLAVVAVSVLLTRPWR